MITNLSIVMPAYNEAGNIANAIEDVLDALPHQIRSYELIVVDDGSTDATARIVSDAALRNPHIVLLRHDVNRGKGAALATGFRQAGSEWLLMIDADQQIPFSLLSRFLEAARTADMVIGRRQQRHESLLRRFSSKVYAHIIAVTLGFSVTDVNCPFKLFRKSLLDGLPLLSHGFLIDAEILAIAHSAGCRLQEIDVPSRPRRQGTSSIRLKHVLETLRELYALKRQTGRYRI